MSHSLGLAGRLIALALATCAWGCSGPDVQENDLRYMVMFNGEGAPIDPMDEGGGDVRAYDTLDDVVYEGRVQQIIENIEASGLERVVVFIHGGLNTQPESIERAVKLHQQIVNEGSYPIFVNWQSNLYSSYRDHLLWLRRGREGSNWELLLTPVYFVEDVVTGLIRFPIVAYSQLVEFAGLGSGKLAVELPDYEHATKALDTFTKDAQGQPQAGHLHLSATDYGANPNHVYWTWIPTLPAKLVSIPVVSMAGPGSWDELKHRVEVLFGRETDFEGDQVVEENHGLLCLMTALADLQCRTGIQIDLVGHSMGTIVMNRILFRGRVTDEGALLARPVAVTPSSTTLPVTIPTFTNVVYLAAACTLRDCAENVFPYLQEHPETRLFNVMLHPKAELAESNAWDLAPRGSLLVWIDDFLSNPIGQGERTAGRADNLLVVLYLIPPEIRSRVYVYVLPLDDDRFPQKHGDFTNPRDTGGNFKFWSRASWFPESANPAVATAPRP